MGGYTNVLNLYLRKLFIYYVNNTLYAMLKKNQQHKQHIWFLQTLKSTQEKPKELFLPTLDRNKN